MFSFLSLGYADVCFERLSVERVPEIICSLFMCSIP